MTFPFQGPRDSAVEGTMEPAAKPGAHSERAQGSPWWDLVPPPHPGPSNLSGDCYANLRKKKHKKCREGRVPEIHRTEQGSFRKGGNHLLFIQNSDLTD